MNIGGGITYFVLGALGIWIVNLLDKIIRRMHAPRDSQLLGLNDLNSISESQEPVSDALITEQASNAKGGRGADISAWSPRARQIYSQLSTYNIPDRKNTALLKKLEESGETEAALLIRSRT